MRWTIEVDGVKTEIDLLAETALRVIQLVLTVDQRGSTRGFSISECMLVTAKYLEGADDVDAESACIVRTLIEKWCEPESKKRARHLKLVHSNDPDGSPTPQAGQ